MPAVKKTMNKRTATKKNEEDEKERQGNSHKNHKGKGKTNRPFAAGSAANNNNKGHSKGAGARRGKRRPAYDAYWDAARVERCRAEGQPIVIGAIRINRYVLLRFQRFLATFTFSFQRHRIRELGFGWHAWIRRLSVARDVYLRLLTVLPLLRCMCVMMRCGLYSKNGAQAFVTVDDLERDVFIDGRKHRNRALEGDIVAVMLDGRYAGGMSQR